VTTGVNYSAIEVFLNLHVGKAVPGWLKFAELRKEASHSQLPDRWPKERSKNNSKCVGGGVVQPLVGGLWGKELDLGR